MYVAAGAGLVILVLSAAVTVQSSRLDACKSKANAQKLMIQTLGAQIEQQNQAVTAAELATKQAQAKGAAARRQAEKATEPLLDQISRLAELVKHRGEGAKSCESGVQDARAALTP
jgi:hypothetical protein